MLLGEDDKVVNADRDERKYHEAENESDDFEIAGGALTEEDVLDH